MKALAALTNRTEDKPLTGQSSDATANQHLWVCIYLPFLAAEALQLDINSTRAFVIYTQQSGKPLIHIASEEARRRGIDSGMELNAAYALYARLQTYTRNPLAEENYLSRLVELCEQYSPTISLQYTNAIQIEVKSSLSLFGGLQSLLQKLHNQLVLHTTRYTIAVSPTPAASHLLASSGRNRIILNREDLRSALGKCPLNTFPLHATEIIQLQKLGLRTGHDLFRLPHKELAHRFGENVSQTLHGLLATQIQEITLVPSKASFSDQIELPFATAKHAVILRYIHVLLKKLSTFLIQKDASISTLTIKLYHSQQHIHTKTLHSNNASRTLDKWALLITENLRQTHLKNTINRISIHCDRLQPYQAINQDLFQKNAHKETTTWQEALDQIKIRLGNECIYSIAYRAHHCPEKAHLSHFNNTKQKSYLQDFNSLAARPAWLLSTPEKLAPRQDQLIFQHTALRIGRNVERIESGWWERRHIRRDYYIAADAQHNLHWIFHDLRRPGTWFLHGHFS